MYIPIIKKVGISSFLSTIQNIYSKIPVKKYVNFKTICNYLPSTKKGNIHSLHMLN